MLWRKDCGGIMKKKYVLLVTGLTFSLMLTLSGCGKKDVQDIKVNVQKHQEVAAEIFKRIIKKSKKRTWKKSMGM